MGEYVRLWLFSGMSACSDFLESESHHTLPDEHSWNTLEDARAGLMGMYGLMRAALADNNTHWACGECATVILRHTEELIWMPSFIMI